MFFLLLNTNLFLRIIGEISDYFLEFWEKFGQFGLFLYSIFETITPIAGVEFFFITLMADHPWWRLALIATLGNAIGAALVYFFLAHKSKFYGRFKTDKNKENQTTKLFDKYGYLAIYIVAMTPLPFFLILLAASLKKMNFKVYMISTINSRGLRFLITTYIMHRFTEFSEFQIILILTILSIPIILIYFFARKIMFPFMKKLILRRDMKKNGNNNSIEFKADTGIDIKADAENAEIKTFTRKEIIDAVKQDYEKNKPDDTNK